MGSPPGLSDPPGRIQVLTEEECWRRLRCADMGRLAMVIDGRPELFPMNYAVSDHTIVIRTAPGTKLEHGPGSIVAFEIDGYGAETGSGWSVVVQGPMEEITEGRDEESKRLRELPVHPYASGAKDHFLAIRARRVTGRRFTWGSLAPALTFLRPPS